MSLKAVNRRMAFVQVILLLCNLAWDRVYIYSGPVYQRSCRKPQVVICAFATLHLFRLLRTNAHSKAAARAASVAKVHISLYGCRVNTVGCCLSVGGLLTREFERFH